MTRDSRKTTAGRSRATSRPTPGRRRTGTGRTTTVRTASTKPTGAGPGGSSGSARAVRKQRSPRSMRRLAVVGALIVFLAVVIAPTVRSYVSERQHVSQLQAQVAAQQANVASLKEQKQKWSDPKYVAAQAGERLGFAKPGKTLTVYVTDQKSKDVAAKKSEAKQTWYGTVWKSVVASGEH
ncbi:FtsB family cell division protein [Flexivirga alba]|uniref:Septum formation initiator family protein n=1 Tax=Flexivirga alba TaxID=702742 RepID=A0ABW2AAI1_9MICO